MAKLFKIYTSRGISWKFGMDSNIKAMLEALRSLLKIEWEHERGESWRQSGVETMLMFRQRGIDKVFFLTVPEAQKVRENIQKHLDADTVMHCQQIGTLMRKYIERDLTAH